MIKDIPRHKVEDLAFAVVPRSLQNPMEDLWDVYILNLRDVPIYSVLVVAKGYGDTEEGKVNSTTLRYFFESIPAQSMSLVEPIQPELFQISNEYWVSFSHEGYLYDKRYIFVGGSILPEHLINLPLGGEIGVMIR